VGEQIAFGLPGAAITRRAQLPADLGRQRLARLLGGSPAQAKGLVLIAANRAPAVAGRRGNRCLALPAAQAPEDIQDLPHGHLSISHLAHLRFRGARKMVDVASEEVDQARENNPNRVDQAREKLAPDGGSSW
jgi:hypothetical protein